MEWEFEWHVVIQTFVHKVEDYLGIRNFIFLYQPDVFLRVKICFRISLDFIL